MHLNYTQTTTCISGLAGEMSNKRHSVEVTRLRYSTNQTVIGVRQIGEKAVSDCSRNAAYRQADASEYSNLAHECFSALLVSSATRQSGDIANLPKPQQRFTRSVYRTFNDFSVFGLV
jgi:hypothetical protein